LARNLGGAMGRQLKQTIVIENVGGAGGNVGVSRAAKAAPDGYTVLINTIGMALSPALYRNLNYDPLTDFEYIGLISDGSMALMARASLPASDFAEIVSYIRANKEAVSFAHSGIGGPSHMCGLLFMSAIQTQVTSVAYRGGGPAMSDLVGGQVDLSCDSVTTATPQIKSGKVKALGVTSRNRHAGLPDVPTLDEQGLKGFELATWQAMYAPKGTPKPHIDRLVSVLQATLRDPEFRSVLINKLGIDPVSQERATPGALQAHLKAEIDKWGPLIRRAGAFAD